MLDDFPIVREAFAQTVRLVTTARLRDPVLKPLIESEEEFAELAEIEGATSSRLIAQNSGIGGISPDEFVYGVPHASFINASFAYAKPKEPNRFNGPNRGAWYAALDVETALGEVIYHMTEFLAAAGDYHATVEYSEMFASFAGEFVDLREIDPTPQCLHRNKAIGYPAGNALADAVRSKGLNGIIYPSVRYKGGICIVGLWPHTVQSVAQGSIYRAGWNGNSTPKVEKI